MATPEQARFLAQFRFQGPGKRVKPRVRSARNLITLVGFLAVYAALACVIGGVVLLRKLGLDVMERWPAACLLYYFVPLLAMLVASMLMLKFVVRRKWVTPQEGNEILSHRRLKHLPPCCWEPYNDVPSGSEEEPE